MEGSHYFAILIYRPKFTFAIRFFVRLSAIASLNMTILYIVIVNNKWPNDMLSQAWLIT
jgi:hypothetical protein